MSVASCLNPSFTGEGGGMPPPPCFDRLYRIQDQLYRGFAIQTPRYINMWVMYKI